jgi:micrococcal nuclease
MRVCIVFLSLTLLGCATSPRAQVLRVTDGDTLHVLLSDGTERNVRIIGIDTPETVHPRKPVQCFGPEASKRMKELAQGKTVELIKREGEDEDRYGRLLRYIMLDGRDLGALMIEEGFARAYRPFMHPKIREYRELEQDARSRRAGLWGKCLGRSRVTISS